MSIGGQIVRTVLGKYLYYITKTVKLVDWWTGLTATSSTRSPVVVRIANRRSTGCQWPSKSSKVDDFYFI